MQNFDQLIGKTIPEAEALLSLADMVLRKAKVDGEWMMGTCDYRLDRVNVIIENDVITEIQGVG
jgi:hypothetical protein